MKFGTKVILRSTPPLTEEQLDEAFAVSENTPLYVALIQILEDAAEDCMNNAAAAAGLNESMTPGGYALAWKEIIGLLSKIEARRQKNAD